MCVLSCVKRQQLSSSATVPQCQAGQERHRWTMLISLSISRSELTLIRTGIPPFLGKVYTFASVFVCLFVWLVVDLKQMKQVTILLS
jgi:hypothetical protein